MTWYRSPLDHTLTGRLDQNTSHEELKQLIAKSSWVPLMLLNNWLGAL